MKNSVPFFSPQSLLLQEDNSEKVLPISCLYDQRELSNKIILMCTLQEKKITKYYFKEKDLRKIHFEKEYPKEGK